MITRDAPSRPIRHAPGLSALHDIVRQSELSGAKRCAVVLFMDRLPETLARPHHVRLIRQTLQVLLYGDRAQTFDVPHGRVAVVWRGTGRTEIEIVRRSLDHLLSGHADAFGEGCGDLLRAYDLPQHAECLLDDLADRAAPDLAGNQLPLDLKLLADLETTLARADLARFARLRPVVALQDPSGLDVSIVPAWEERYFSIDDLVHSLAPGRDLQAAPYLFGRLTRTLDQRMLALLASPGALARCGPFAISVNVATILSPAFLRFDSLLLAHLRGEVILTLRPADILADGVDFVFARNFARARLYRLALADVTPTVLALLDVTAAGIDLLHLSLTPTLRDSDPAWRRLVAPGSGLVLTGINCPSELRWAVAHGFRLGCGALFNR